MTLREYLYPFTSRASEFLSASGITLEDLVRSAAFESARLRAKERILQAIKKGEIKKSTALVGVRAEKELFSYLLAQIFVSCVEDTFLLRRYATAEAKAAYKQLLVDFYSEAAQELIYELSEDFGVRVAFDGDGRTSVKVHFTDYLRLTNSIRDESWKLVNRPLHKGWVALSLEEFARLMQEAVRGRILKKLPLNVNKEVCKALRPYLEEIARELAKKKEALGVGVELRMEIDEDCFPPCISELLRHVRSGMSVSHPARFAVTSFLLNLGINVEKVVATFVNLPDFDEEKTRYQVEHIAGVRSSKKYSPPSCATMQTYGNCFKNADCEGISHPLAYYERKLREKYGGNRTQEGKNNSNAGSVRQLRRTASKSSKRSR
ncbi:DNA primase regulatory subunit PriL [Candidatus Alkanophaga liquidiphilum]|nr:Eukaryotic-type DNA primase [Candidatus Alkanophaga liquidiphilum]